MTAYADTISRPVKTLTEAEQRALLKVTGQHVDGFRDHVIFSLAMGTGLREHYVQDSQFNRRITPNTPVFVSRLGRRLSARQLRHLFAVWQERAGFERHVGFHTLRHHACSAVYRQSKDLRLTQKFARHKSVVTTSIYTHPTDDELLRAVQGLVC